MPPPEITDEGEQTLWRDLVRLYENFLEEAPKVEWPERARRFQGVMSSVREQISDAQDRMSR